MHQTYWKPAPRAVTKPPARRLVKRPKAGSLKAVRQSIDRMESAKVRERSKGQCEVCWFGATGQVEYRCERRATQVHHMIGGRGKRGIGISARAQHKQHVCDQCHLDITGDICGKKLQRIGGVVPLWNDKYSRVK